MVTTEHFSRLVHEIYDAAVESNNWTVALEDLSSSVGATGCALLISGSAHNEITMKSVGADPASMTAYNDYYGAMDPSPGALDRVPTGVVIPSEQLHDRDLLTRSEFWNEWADPNDYGDGIYTVLARDEAGTSWRRRSNRTHSAHPRGSRSCGRSSRICNMRSRSSRGSLLSIAGITIWRRRSMWCRTGSPLSVVTAGSSISTRRPNR
jgi:hypothetical protein